ncbi:MAG: acetyl-CoA carboxylase, carboxyltransferase subunit beta [Candidatus Saccharicenans sp.]|jgi:acetyl-CoA carboxylase carboxyl transferase subunit beta|nr:acetyl-CoA carboxylase, carboxyltransferase subunit beta [Candidatus Saccharicenans sp.]MDH7493287.1 acetyl-CoA carboxylase, carboxyltransferase subunit beta [Candidatus Saccharicenans sp.]
MTEGLWTRCNNCQKILYKQDIIDNLKVCPQCNYHFRLGALERLQQLFDNGQFELLDQDIYPVDFLGFQDQQRYAVRLEESQKKSGLPEAIVTGRGTIGGLPVIIQAMEFGFMGGSMGSVVGEKVARAAERAVEEKLPLIIVSCSGGARMQEGMMSLMQMIKTAAALARLSEARLPYISVLADPTTGGTTASFAMLGDLNIAEPNALIGFAGPRVIEQTIKEKLPKGFQRAEFLLAHGMLDVVVERKYLRNYLIKALRLFLNKPQS